MREHANLPPRVLPVLYFGLAHAALALAFAAIVWDPLAVVGFFYHPRMLGIVHLLTLGWITASILGSLYLVGPIALRVTFPARWPDYSAFGLALAGIAGMVAHFWIEEYGGMAWSAGTAGFGILLAGWRVVPGLRASAAPRAVLVHVGLAFVNVGVAATMGLLLGIEKVHHFLPGYVMDNVYAHAHLAAIGWATMMVVGVAYRLLPMVLPAAMPDGRRLWPSALLLEAGALGVFVTLMLRTRLLAIFAFLAIAGLAAFFRQVLWMLRHPRPKPPAIKRPDPAVLHAGAALASLAIACGLGVWLSMAAVTARTPQIAFVYGIFGLLGFLAQMVVAMEGRLLPLFAWYWAFANTNYKGPVRSPHEMVWRPGQHVVFGLWLFGVPALAWGLASAAVPWVRAAAWALLAATIIDTAQVANIVRHAFGGGHVAGQA